MERLLILNPGSTSTKLAGFIVGATCPIVMTSRGSSPEEKFLSIVIATAAAAKSE